MHTFTLGVCGCNTAFNARVDGRGSRVNCRGRRGARASRGAHVSCGARVNCGARASCGALASCRARKCQEWKARARGFRARKDAKGGPQPPRMKNRKAAENRKLLMRECMAVD